MANIKGTRQRGIFFKGHSFVGLIVIGANQNGRTARSADSKIAVGV